MCNKVDIMMDQNEPKWNSQLTKDQKKITEK
jgi:hypothetical protein